ncbi:hypothetical protein [Nonomuraea jiangxiensis]|uniref:Uncharacterized protein n=1 Tax=Nonomuraea jiangxiensis TaxID=633440 RepID=A0A1G8DQ79_9ACTN|nr:hypothetical protein [Nonomuraea jiangxiensis]SDH59580.1 hypothetical protein SAMN05421869_102633 [Nonomuraea jiangxiensis]
MPPVATTLMIAASIAGGLVPVTQAPMTMKAAVTAPNLRACYDGKCNLTLTKRVTFRVSSKFGITRLAISFTGQSVLVKGTGPGVMSQARLSKGSSGSVNGIGVRVAGLSSGKAVLRLAPVR